MPTIKEKIYFNYDGIWSSSFGLINVNIGNDMFEENLTASRSIIETQPRGQNKPLHQGFNNEPLEIPMTIAFTEKYTDEKIYEIIDWLFQDYYKPLYFHDREDRIFYCMPVGDSKIIHNGLNQGYFTITMRCNSPFVYSPVILSEIYDLSEETTKNIELFNNGYGDLYPEISIEKIEDGNVSIRNLSNNGEMWELRNLTNLEKLYINCEKETIQTDLVGLYRYNDVYGIYPRLIKGRNLLEISGKCKVQFRYQYKYRF